jgi:hypothetical protein
VQYRSAFERLWGVDVRKWNGKKVKAVLNPEAGNNGYVRVDVAGRTVGFLPDHVAKKYSGKSNAHRTCRGRVKVLSPHTGHFVFHVDLMTDNQRATQAGYATPARHARTSHKSARIESAEGMI